MFRWLIDNWEGWKRKRLIRQLEEFQAENWRDRVVIYEDREGNVFETFFGEASPYSAYQRFEYEARSVGYRVISVDGLVTVSCDRTGRYDPEMEMLSPEELRLSVPRCSGPSWLVMPVGSV